MIEFEEPEKGYVFEGSNFTKKKPKIRLVILLLIFFVVIGFFVKNDYNFNFFKKSKPFLVFQCSDEINFDKHATKEVSYETATKALLKNIVLLKSKAGFIDSSISFEKVGKTKMVRPVINLIFKDDTEFIVPDKMCDFRVKVLYR